MRCRAHAIDVQSYELIEQISCKLVEQLFVLIALPLSKVFLFTLTPDKWHEITSCYGVVLDIARQGSDSVEVVA